MLLLYRDVGGLALDDLKGDFLRTLLAEGVLCNDAFDGAALRVEVEFEKVFAEIDLVPRHDEFCLQCKGF